MSLSDDTSSSTIPQLSLLPNVRPRLEKTNRIAVWRLPSEISQSRLCGRTSPSNACTLIALQLIELFERRNLHFSTPSLSRTPLTASTSSRSLRAHAGAESPRAVIVASTRYLIGTFVEAMVEGNEAHERAVETRGANEQNFTIPDAIKALHRRHTEIDFCSVSGSFTQQLPRFIRIALRSPSLLPLMRIHFVIIAFERTVLLVADRRTNSFILLDSHLHGSPYSPTTGAVVATSHFSELNVLIQWMSEHIFPETYSPNIVQEFEISTVAYADTARDCMEIPMGGFSPYRPSAVPLMGPMAIFAPPPMDKENAPPDSRSENCHSVQQEQQPQQPAKKLNKRCADSQGAEPLGSSINKRARSDHETITSTTVARHFH